MRILVIGGMHGNEPLGPQVVAIFKKNPVKNVDVLLANKQAIALKSRLVRQDLNRSFPGKINSKEYEPRRAARLLKLCTGYDVVLDFHNTHCPNNDCGFVGAGAGEQLYMTSVALGINRVIVADYDCINKYALNCLSVEVSLHSPLNNAALWYERIAMLSRLERPTTSLKELKKYKFVYRMTLEDKAAYNLPAQKLQAFTPIKDTLAKSMRLRQPAYPIFVNDAYTPYNYGGILNDL